MKNAQVLIGRFCLLSLLFLIFLSSSFAQSRSITGRVVTGTNVPLEGVSVRLKGSQTGTVTDRAGNYSIGVRGSSPVLVFSYVGLEEQEE
ncbi:MAG TPA: carboxypeptidase-like regulatory domain-containing protein, partial [Flavitalea sp.]|nr:carboxypeptidase-like regulatory domain-containing protein [Flavitalea sp.]